MYTVAVDSPFYFFYSNTGPVSYLQIRPCISIKQCRLATVRVTDKGYGHPLCRYGITIFYPLRNMFFTFRLS